MNRDFIIMSLLWGVYLTLTHFLLGAITLPFDTSGFINRLILELVRTVLGFYLIEYVFNNYFDKNDSYQRGRR